MSFVINTTIDKTKELMEAYNFAYKEEMCKDVILIAEKKRVAVHSFALAVSSEFFFNLFTGLGLGAGQGFSKDVEILIPEISFEILKKVVEYLYIGSVMIDQRQMGDFIDICNLLQLKATISCERKLVFDTIPTAIVPGPSTSIEINNKLEGLVAECNLLDVETLNIKTKDDSMDQSGVMEIYEVNIDGLDTFELDEDAEHYELMSVEKPDTSTPRERSSNRIKMLNDDGSVYYEISSDRRSKAPFVDEGIFVKALDEIMNNTSSFRLVSEKYNIPKTILWRRAKKEGYIKGERPKDSNRLTAIEEIKKGDSLINLSKKFNIPISTLHRDKLKLYENGNLPDNVNLKNRSRGNDFEERLRNAIAEVLNGKSQNEAAKKYALPKTTIWRVIKKIDLREVKKEDDITCDSEIITAALIKTPRRKQNAKIELLPYKEDEDDMDDVDDDDDYKEVIPIAKARKAPKREPQTKKTIEIK
ncbi:unnamed protein product [Diamesa serratosioi]